MYFKFISRFSFFNSFCYDYDGNVIACLYVVYKSYFYYD